MPKPGHLAVPGPPEVTENLHLLFLPVNRVVHLRWCWVYVHDGVSFDLRKCKVVRSWVCSWRPLGLHLNAVIHWAIHPQKISLSGLHRIWSFNRGRGFITLFVRIRSFSFHDLFIFPKSSCRDRSLRLRSGPNSIVTRHRTHHILISSTHLRDEVCISVNRSPRMVDHQVLLWNRRHYLCSLARRCGIVEHFTFHFVEINYWSSIFHFTIPVQILLEKTDSVLLHVCWVAKPIVQVVVDQPDIADVLFPLRDASDRLPYNLFVLHKILILMRSCWSFGAQMLIIWESVIIGQPQFLALQLTSILQSLRCWIFRCRVIMSQVLRL